MTGTHEDLGAPIDPGSPLARKLDDFAVPGLTAGFAERVLAAATAAAEAGPASLPELRRDPRARRRTWRIGGRTGRRVLIGLAAFGTLASAAAATGLLERLDIAVPSPGAVWANLTGTRPAAPEPTAAAPAPAAPAAIAAPTPVRLEGPIDTPEELDEAFRRIDEVRGSRRETRRALVDRRLDEALERRRAAGLPVPSAEEEARLRERLDQARTRREEAARQRIETRREDLRRKVEAGEAVTREDILPPAGADERATGRRERLRDLPPAERRARIEAWRQRRAEQAGEPSGEAAGEPSAPPPPPE